MCLKKRYFKMIPSEPVTVPVQSEKEKNTKHNEIKTMFINSRSMLLSPGLEVLFLFMLKGS